MSPISRQTNGNEIVRRNENSFSRVLRSTIQMICLLLLLTISGRVTAAYDLNYTISYDPATEITTIFNSPSSGGALPFWTDVGEEAFVLLGLPINSSIEIDGNTGLISENGSLWSWKDNLYSKNKPPQEHSNPVNVDAKNKSITITNTSIDKKILVIIDHIPTYIDPGKTFDCPINTHCFIAPVAGATYTLTDAYIEASAGTGVDLGPGSDIWPYAPDDYLIELNTGTMMVQDNTGGMLTIWTGEGGVTVGCIPEPGTWTLIAIALYTWHRSTRTGRRWTKEWT